jgi:glycosyltransferase involved in cell wall biosynthesis
MARVLHVIESLAAGGAERVVVEYATAHDRERYVPEICCVRSSGPLVDTLRASGVPVHELGRRFGLDPRPAFRLAALIRREKFDVVHNHNFAALSVGVAASMFSGVRVLVRTEHNVTLGGSPARALLSRAAALREDAQIAVSEAVRRSHVQAGRVPEARFVVVRNGISEDRLRPDVSRGAVRGGLGIGESEFVCLNIGSLTRQKNRVNLLKAVSLLGDVERLRVLIVGSGPREAELRELSTRLGLEERVHFLGERLDISNLLGASDAFVLSSDWEGLPITLLEAMAAGLPSVATSVGGVPEVISEGETGYIVPPNDAEALAGGIRALAADEGLRSRMAHAARDAFRKRFRAEQMVRQTEALYDLAAGGCVLRATAGRIKVLYVIGQLGRGGAERQTAELVKLVPRDIFEPVVCCLSGPGAVGDEIEDAGVRVVYLDKSRGAFSGTTARLLALIRRERPAVLHSYLFSASWRSLIAGRLMRVPLLISSVRNVDIHTKPLAQVVDWALAAFNDRVIANAEAVKEYVSRRHFVATDRIHVIYNGVSLSRARDAAAGRRDAPSEDSAGHEQTPAAATGPRVGMIASLTVKKDHATFLRAADIVRGRVPGARFVLVGDGELRDDVSDMVQSMGLGDVVGLEGARDDIGSVLADLDVSVLSSLKEGCSNVVLESMATGRPVVVTDVGGNSELVEDGKVGFVVPVGDAEAMADRIVRLLTDADLRRRMGEAGSARVEELFTAETMTERTVEFYLSMLERRVPGLPAWARISASRRPPGA